MNQTEQRKIATPRRGFLAALLAALTALAARRIEREPQRPRTAHDTPPRPLREADFYRPNDLAG